MKISKEFISSVAVNDSAVKNGAGLVKKNSFTVLTVDSEQKYIGGECTGSGSKLYICSADFADESAPVFRCTCPSRQIPCKHVLGLLWAFAEGLTFATADVPPDILEKRRKKEQRVSKSKENREVREGSAKDTAAWKRAAVKKVETQAAGISEAEKILQSIVQMGLGAADAKNIQNYKGLVKQLDSYFITGVQSELNDLLGMFQSCGEAPYSEIVEKLCRIQALLTRAKAYLAKKLEQPENMDTQSEIEELIGYPWKLEELRRYGLFEKDAKLVQLCFHVRQEYEKRQFVDEGFYISLSSGKIYKTRNYRPFKALKYIKEDDSVFSVLQVPELFIYPSLSLNPRIRWEAFTLEEVSGATYKLIQSHGESDFTVAIKNAKNQLKNLMLSRHPVALVQFQKLKKVEGMPDEFVILDGSGNVICLRQNQYCQENFLPLLDKLPPEALERGAMLLLFDNDVEAGVLSAQPLALITDRAIIRLVF